MSPGGVIFQGLYIAWRRLCNVDRFPPGITLCLYSAALNVHHGNGTQHIFEEDDTVFYFSTHQHPHYPGTGDESEQGKAKGIDFTYNVPLRRGSGDMAYIVIYQDILPGLVSKFSPDILLVSAGYDLLQRDPLSGIHVSTEGIGTIVYSILTCWDCPVVFTLEGGYDLTALSEGVKTTIAEMLKN